MTSSLFRIDRERLRQPGRLLAGLLSCALLVACAAKPPVIAEAPKQPPVKRGWLDQGTLPTVLRLPNYPATAAQTRTTSATIYLGNLDARINHLEKTYAAQPRPEVANALALSLGHRARIVGKRADMERAGQVLQEQLTSSPDDPQLLLTHARWLSQLHRFNQALASLERIPADNPGLEAPVAELRAEIDLALGRYQSLDDTFWHPEQPGRADLYELAARANAAIMQGQLDLASRLYFDAQSHYRDVGPFPLAWLHVQQGIALLRFGHYAEAAKFFEAARERIPQFYLATEHLAECLTELGEYDHARALYLEVIEQTANPEFMAALAGLESAAGDLAAAQRWQSRADEGYESLLRDHPAAYTQHAAEYFLETGRIERALTLATANLALRQDLGSRLLYAEAVNQHGDAGAACEQLRLAGETGLNPPELQSLRSQISCP